MLDLPLIYQNFMSAVTFEADYETKQGKETLWIESRIYLEKLNEPHAQVLFTCISGNTIRVPSIQHLILQKEDCLSLSIPHSVTVDWDTASKRAILTEVYVPHHGFIPSWGVQLLLHVDDRFFKTGLNDTLQDAFLELDEQVGSELSLFVKVCYQCDYSYDAPPGTRDERENLQCFRDNPERLQEVKKMNKFASAEALRSGHFFVNSFHTCAAWRPWTAS